MTIKFGEHHLTPRWQTGATLVMLPALAAGLAACGGSSGSSDAVETPPSAAAGTTAGSASGVATPSPEDETTRDNEFILEPKSGVSTVTFTWSGDSVITDGQKFDGVKPGSDANSYIAVAGREASEYPADWFKKNSGVVAISTDCFSDCGGTWPQELNFAFTGTITIDGTDYPIALGQGRAGSGDNNWWVGGGEGFNGKGTVVTPDSLYAIYASDPAKVASYWFGVCATAEPDCAFDPAQAAETP